MKRLAGILFFCSALCGIIRAEGDPAIAFAGPEVVKLDWATRSLQLCDLNGDGLNDLALINNDLAKIELLVHRDPEAERGPEKKRVSQNRWEPVLEDARFISEGVNVGFPVFDLAVGDLNGDGRADLAYTAKEVPLTVRFQDADGTWSDFAESDSFEALGWTGTLKIDDLDGDGAAELVVMASDALYIYGGEDNGTLDVPSFYYLAGDNPFNLITADVDADGRKDLLYITSNGKQSLVLRLQLSDGRFGPELRFPFERPIRRVAALPDPGGETPLFASVDARGGALEFFRLEKSVDGGSGEAHGGPHPDIYPIFKKGRESASYALSDLDGDGAADLLVSNPAAAELALFMRTEGRFTASLNFPSFSGISSLAGGRFLARRAESVVVVSAGEKSMGVASMTESGRISFPREISLDRGDPLVCGSVDMDGDGFDELALITKEDGRLRLVLARPAQREGAGTEWEVISQTELDSVNRDPVGLCAVDIFEGGQKGIMVFVPREAPVLLRSNAASPFVLEPFAVGSTVRQNLLKGITRPEVSVIDVDGSGVKELVVCRTGYARALRATPEGLEMVDQFNARRSDDVVAAVVPTTSGGEITELWFYVPEAGELQVAQRDADGVFRYHASSEVGSLSLLQWFQLGSTDRSRVPLLFAGEDRFWVLEREGNRWVRDVVDRYETDLENVKYSHVDGADFDGDGAVELLAVDGQNHVVELLGRDSGGDGWSSIAYWKIFEQNMHYQGRKGGNFEPREALIGDLSDDGRPDFTFLIHDRILIYPQVGGD